MHLEGLHSVFRRPARLATKYAHQAKQRSQKNDGFLQLRCICAFARLLQPVLLEFSVAVYVQTVCHPQKKPQILMEVSFVSGCKSRPVVKGVFWL